MWTRPRNARKTTKNKKIYLPQCEITDWPASYQCNVGQKPGVLTKGRTYKVRQAIVYTHTDGKMYKAIMEVHLKML